MHQGILLTRTIPQGFATTSPETPAAMVETPAAMMETASANPQPRPTQQAADRKGDQWIVGTTQTRFGLVEVPEFTLASVQPSRRRVSLSQ